jgi:hypothetical protein
MRINNIMRQWRNKLPRPPLLQLWSADDLSAFLSGLDLAYPSAVASSVRQLSPAHASHTPHAMKELTVVPVGCAGNVAGD